MIPILQTERLILRAPDGDDLHAWSVIMADPDVTRYIAPAPMTREDAWRSIAGLSGIGICAAMAVGRSSASPTAP